MIREGWIRTIALIGYSWCAMFAFGYSSGEKYILKSFENPVITEYGRTRFDIGEIEKDMEVAGYKIESILPDGTRVLGLK